MPITGIVDRREESDLCDCDYEYDYELVEDIRGRMILHWNYRNLKEIPLEVLNHGEHIEEIYLKRNCLEKLPSNIGKLTNLTNIYLQGNQLEELPNEIGDLRSLRVLDISLNYVRKLPSRIGELKLLENLLLTYNQLEELPKCLAHLHRLKQLEISGNRIHYLPEDIIHGLHSLEEFGIDRNPISFLPRNLCLLRNLRYFSACRCNLLLLPSLPFQSLLCKSSNNSNPPLSRRQQARNNNNNLQLLFDGNPRLNYVPYWVLQLMGSNVECFGCGLDPGENDSPVNSHHPNASTSTQLQLYTYHTEVNRPRVKLNFKGKRRTLHFDQDLVSLHRCGLNQSNSDGTKQTVDTSTLTVASLYELCLRQTYRLDLTQENSCMTTDKPVVEPLIVPQRAGHPVIKIRGDLQRMDGDDDEPKSCKEDEKTAKKSDNENEKMEASTQPTSSTSLKEQDQSLKKECESRSTTATNQKKDNEGFLLPTHISRMLLQGPVAKCFQCLTPIFTESWPIIFHIPGWVWNENNHGRGGEEGEPGDGDGGGDEMEDNVRDGEWNRRQDDEVEGKLSIGCAHFCSHNCVNKFRNSTRFSSNLVMNDLKCIVDNELEWIAI